MLSNTATHKASRASKEVLQNVQQAAAGLHAAFDRDCMDEDGVLRRPDQCSDTLVAAIRALLDAQSRLVETDWPQPPTAASLQAEADDANHTSP